MILNSLNSYKALAVLYSFKNIANANLLKFLAAQPYKAIQLGGLYSWGVNSSKSCQDTVATSKLIFQQLPSLIYIPFCRLFSVPFRLSCQVNSIFLLTPAAADQTPSPIHFLPNSCFQRLLLFASQLLQKIKGVGGGGKVAIWANSIKLEV